MEQERAQVSIPEGGMINGEISIVSYFDKDGVLSYAYNTAGEMTLSGFLGVIECAKFLMYQDFQNQIEEDEIRDEDDDDDL